MTDESIALVFCTCDGELNKDGLEDDEDIEAILVSVEEARKIPPDKPPRLFSFRLTVCPVRRFAFQLFGRSLRIPLEK